ncbi:hypothetical protein [Gordonia zhaorongruii]|uniref:hypothetical protein n=1 Tax=Gordonia zhaorongruii TaxID=2597659 RepID=UPI001045DD5A|nr:hypothetical protein [Gordonia zhaorongruii]
MNQPQQPNSQSAPNQPAPGQPAPVQPAGAQGRVGGTAEAENEYSGFSIGAVVAIVGAVLTLIAYPLEWFVVEADEGATINGLGQTTSTSTYEVVFEGSKLHWLAGAAAIGMIIAALARLIGKFDAKWEKLPIIFGGLAIVSAVLSIATIGDGFKAGIGLYLVVVGAVITLAGGLVMSLMKK